MTGRGQRARMAVRRGRAGPGGCGQPETGVDRTSPAPGHAPAGTPVGPTPAAARRTETKQCGAARTERPRPTGKASTTGAAQRALALEPGSFRYDYRIGQAARCRDVARSLENRMETTTSVLQPPEDAAPSLRTSRVAGYTPTLRLTRSPSLYPSTHIVPSVRHEKHRLAPYATMPQACTKQHRTPTIVGLPSFGRTSSVRVDPDIFGADDSAFDTLALYYLLVSA